MAETSSPMEIDSSAPPPPALAKVNKGKSPVVSGGKSAPWVEKYRPQSLADVAAHRDIVDTSRYT
jgi:replication factor C subunit 3/5